MKDVLIINSYAGSLTIGTSDAGYPIRGSYEDSGFGIEAQKLNFPSLHFVDTLPWPSDDLTDTVVMSHPPCAAFSNQNNSPRAKGVDTDAFKCHKQVMEYALGRNCAALAIESVSGVIKAAPTYAEYAQRFGYNHCFVELNAISFGVPQWRPRIWTLFFRKELSLPFFKAWFQPAYKPLEAILQNPHTEQLDVEYAQPKLERWRKQIPRFDEYIASDYLGGFLSSYQKFADVEWGCWDDCRAVIGVGAGIGTELPKKISRLGYAPVILYPSMFFVDGRPLSRIELQRVMGFPDDYQWPVVPKKNGKMYEMVKDFRLYLSKGVCPPVARFIVDQLWYNVTEQNRADWTNYCEWGQVLNLEPKKAEVDNHLSQPTKYPAPRQAHTYLPPGVAPDEHHPAEIAADNYVETVPDATGDSLPRLNGFAGDVKLSAVCTHDPNTCEVGFCGWPNKCPESSKAKPRIVAKLVGFEQAPVEGEYFQYVKGVMKLTQVVRFDAEKRTSKEVKDAIDQDDLDTHARAAERRARQRTPTEELKARATGGYQLVDREAPIKHKEKSHAWAIVRALQLLDNCPTDRFTPTRQEIVEEIEAEQHSDSSTGKLINTTMAVDKAVAFMLNVLVKNGEVVLL